MADATLSREHALVLLHKLVHDDEFRRRFEAKPADLLAEIGIPADVIEKLPFARLANIKVVEQGKLAQLHKQIEAQTESEWLCMIPPNFKLNIS